MLQGNCANCLFWESKDEGKTGDCYRAKGTTAVSGCGSCLPRWVAEKIGEVLLVDQAFITALVAKIQPKEAKTDAVRNEKETQKGRKKG